MFCQFGCGSIAKFIAKSKKGKSRCEKSFYDCPAYREKISKSNIGKHSNKSPWNKGLSGKDDIRVLHKSETKAKISESGLGRKHKKETVNKISNSMMGNRNANHRGDRQSRYNGIRMDSSWEVAAAKYFDKNNIKWKYNEKGFVLSDGRYYYPDFFIYVDEDFIKLIEIKGFFRESNKKKYDMFLQEYPEIKIELWQKKQLIEKGII